MSVWINKVNRISVSVWGCAVWKNFPAMAYARTSAGPAGRPGACIFQGRVQFRDIISIPRPFLFENRSLVDFQIGNEGHGGDLDENGCFTSKEMRFALYRYGSRGNFLFQNQSFIDFQIGNERKREFRAAEMRFYLHKEFCAAEIRFYLYKEFSRGTMWQLFDSECSSRSFPLWK